MTLAQARKVKLGDRVIFKFDPLKGNEAVVTEVSPPKYGTTFLFAVESKVTRPPYWVSHKKIDLKP